MFLVTIALLVQTAVLFTLTAELELSVTLLDWGGSQLFQYKPPEVEGRSGQLKCSQEFSEHRDFTRL